MFDHITNAIRRVDVNKFTNPSLTFPFQPAPGVDTLFDAVRNGALELQQASRNHKTVEIHLQNSTYCSPS